MSKQSGAVKVGQVAPSVPETTPGGHASVSVPPARSEPELVVRELPGDAIEPDPAQPRRVFDEEALRRLAESIRRYGLLQEPGVVQVETSDGDRAPRYRLIWGERRWRASKLAGLASIRCKVFPANSSSTAENLRLKEQQWAENMERAGLSPIEEAIAIQDTAELERTLRPDLALGTLVEEIGERRGLHRTVARNLVALLKTPRSLQAALLARDLKREVGFELTRFWNRLLAENELRGAAKREIQYRNLVASWARARGLELGAQAMTRYAAETFQDPKIVKATCRKAEESERALLARFDDVVTRAAKERWTVAKTKAEVAALRRDAAHARPLAASSAPGRIEVGAAAEPYTGAP